jgi:DNA primase small subunit
MAKTLAVRIDPQVTMDVHRIFRMPGTINSKSGLVKMRCDDFESFDPLKDSCLLGDNEVKVNTKLSSQMNFKLEGQSFRIRENNLKLPVFAAVFLIRKVLPWWQIKFAHQKLLKIWYCRGLDGETIYTAP